MSTPRLSGAFLSNTQGYTLYLVMIILAIAGILFSITERELWSMHVFTNKEVHHRQAKLLAESGIIRTEYFLNGGDGHSITWETPGFEETLDTFGMVSITVERFGFFSRVTSTGKRLATTSTIKGLFGRTVPTLLTPTLTLTGHVAGLILQNGSSIKGDIVLRHGNIYAKKNGPPLPGYARRLNIRESPPLPFDSLALPNLFEDYRRQEIILKGQGRTTDGSLVLDGNNDSLLQCKSLTVNGDCLILTPRAVGAVIIVTGTCRIENGAILNQTTCYADRIIIQGGSTEASFFFSTKTITIETGYHNSQFLSSDSIVVRSNALFGDMTVFANYRQDRSNDFPGGIFIDEQAIVTGTVISCIAPGAVRNTMLPSITLDRGSKVKGAIITDGDCFMSECEIVGHVWARSILTENNRITYVNYLVGSSITLDREDRPFPLLGDIPLKTVFVRTLRHPQRPEPVKQGE